MASTSPLSSLLLLSFPASRYQIFLTSIEFFAINDQTNTLPKVMSKAQSILSVASEGVERVGSKKRAIEVIPIDEDSDDDDCRRHEDHSPGRSSTTERSKPVPKAQSSPRRIGRDTTRKT